MMRNFLPLTLLPCACFLSSCVMGPDYQRPDVSVPDAYRGRTDVDQNIGWKLGEPSDHVSKGTWWTIFNDPVLNDLEARAMADNVSLAAALARVDSARATARQSKADFFPQLTAEPAYQRERRSEEVNGGILGRNPSNEFRVPFDLSYEIDLWGKVRRQVEASSEEAKASVADFQNLMLSLQSELAQNYFTYRALNAEIRILANTLESRVMRLDLISKRAQAGESSDLDVRRAESEQKTTEAELERVLLQRLQLQNAIATLVGEPASTFTMPDVDATVPEPPVIPVGLPSDLLERRPDVAAAERRLAARNAEIGVAKASFFPVIKLTGQTGLSADDLGSLFTADALTWSYGPSIFIPIFQAGQLGSRLERTEAEYNAAVFDYRQQILVAFQEVEDSLVAVDSLRRRLGLEESAMKSAREAERLSQIRYEAGVVSYLEALDAQRTALELERAVVTTRGQKMITLVNLIKALGGGWNVPSTP